MLTSSQLIHPPRARYAEQKLRPPLKWHGGKFYLSRQLIEVLPQRTHYCEPYAGGASVLLNLRRFDWSRRLLSDKNPKLVALYLVLRDQTRALIDRLRQVDYTLESFDAARRRDDARPNAAVPTEEQMDVAVDYFVRMRMSRGGLGTAFAWSDRKRGGQPGDVNAWCTLRDGKHGLTAIGDALQGVDVTCSSTIDLLCEHGQDREFLFYLDPPYVRSTRTATNAYGAFEMDVDDHAVMAEMANRASCAVAISGYDCIEYRQWFAGWRRLTWDMPNHAGQCGRKQRRTECLWINEHRWSAKAAVA